MKKEAVTLTSEFCRGRGAGLDTRAIHAAMTRDIGRNGDLIAANPR
jgi:hypothetical protein